MIGWGGGRSVAGEGNGKSVGVEVGGVSEESGGAVRVRKSGRFRTGPRSIPRSVTAEMTDTSPRSGECW